MSSKPRQRDRRVAVVGMGYWGRNLVRNFEALGALATICDEARERQSQIARQYPGVAFVPHYEAVLADDRIDAVVLATPAITHAALARQALAAGKDVFVEKPLALTVADGEELVRAAAEKQRILMVGHILRYHPAVSKLQELIHEGELGKLHYVYSSRLNIGKIRTEENILWSFAPHDISVMLALLREEPAVITCQGGTYLSLGVPDVTMSQFVFPSGVRGHIFVSWLHPVKEQRLVLIGSEKMAVFDDTAEHKLAVYPHRVEWRDRVPTAVKAEASIVEIDAIEPLRAECEHFLECVRERRPPRTDGEEGLRVLRVLSVCQQDLERGQTPSGGGRPRPAANPAPPGGFVHETACVDAGARVGPGTRVWHFSHVMKGACLGRDCILGQNVHIGSDVTIGDRVKIQNNVSVYTGAAIEDDVFLGPSCVLTNVTNPRSQIDRHALFEPTLIRRGASIGANATIVCGATVGRYAFVGAGAVVTRDVPDYALVVGNPARRIDWMSRHGHRLGQADAEGIMVCPESGYRYREQEPGCLRCLDLDEDAPLPPEQRLGRRSYDSFRQ